MIYDLEDKLEYPRNLSMADQQKTIQRAMTIDILHQWFKSHLRADFVRQELTPLEKHPYLKQEDWNQFVEITTSEDFERKSHEMKDMQALHTKPHKMGRKG